DWSMGNAFLKDACAFVYHGVEAALEDLLILDATWRNTGLAPVLLQYLGDRRIGARRAVACLVAIDTGSGLLPIAAQFDDAVEPVASDSILRAGLAPLLPDAPADIEAR